MEPEIVVTMDKERETKGTFLYKERLSAGQTRGAIGTLYLTKAAVATLDNPDTIVVRVGKS